jgi:hypothetical protein
VAEALAPAAVGEAPDHRPARVVDEGQRVQLLERGGDVATDPEHEREQEAPAVPHRRDHGDRGRLALDVRHYAPV